MNLLFSFFTIKEPRFLNLEYLFNQFFELLKKLLEYILWLLKHLALYFLKFPLLMAALVFVLLSAIILYKIYKLKRRKKIANLVRFTGEDKATVARSSRWKAIKGRIDSDDAQDWKLAIVEADSIMDDILNNIGYKGDGLADKLKSVEPSDFLSIQDIWEAYKIRSKIAQQGEKLELTKEEARAALEKYEKGLKELGYV